MKLVGRNFRFLAAASISAVALLLLAGCGSSTSAPQAIPTPQPTRADAVPTKPASAGTIMFGETVSGHTVTKPNGKDVFKTPKHTFAWVATLSPKPSSGNLTVTVVRTAGALVHPDTVWTVRSPIRADAQYASYTMTGAQLKANNIIATGTYSLTYTQASKTLASGSFQISTRLGQVAPPY
jgi:hypothetical protein